MFSPQDRICNTPDVSEPIVASILRQLRLERIFKRFGFLAHCNPLKPPSDTIAPPLVKLGPPAPTRTPRPFGAHEATTGWQRSRNIQISKPKLPKKSNKPTNTGYPVHLWYDRETIGGCKYGGVHLSEYESRDTSTPRVDIFKPFQPLKSPQRLPALQRERKELSFLYQEFKIQDSDVHKRTELAMTKRNTELKKLPAKVARKKKKKRDVEFMKWETSPEHPIAVNDLRDYASTCSKEATHRHVCNEQKYREQIQTQIKQGVQQRVEGFGQGGKMFAKSTQNLELIPVLELEFQDENVITRRVSRK